MLSMKAKYALRAMMVLARNEKRLMQTKTIAQEADVPHKFLEVILSDLRNHGLVESKRGIMGGYNLSKPADVITIGDVIRIMDGPLAPIRCASVTAYQPCDDCPDVAKCAIRSVMKDVRIAISGVLDQRTIKDMLSLPKGAATLLDHDILEP
ncbi:MAG TPA: Rrf2 family transcriptional regulator [Rickettsiales bacterium]|nr:Rrf2 family transcriptional regulator [Rickettsiales bacterium]